MRTRYIRIAGDRPRQGTVVVFAFSEERPTLSSRTGRTFQRIRTELAGLTAAEVATILLNLCSLETERQGQIEGGM